MFKHENIKSYMEIMQMKLDAMEEKPDKVSEITNFVEKCESLERQIR
jgi:hypothetical protein